MYRPAGRPAPLPAPLPRKRGSPPGTATLRVVYRLLHCYGGQGTQTTIPAQEGIGCSEPPEGGGKSQQLVVVTRHETGFERELLMPVTFVPLIVGD